MNKKANMLDIHLKYVYLCSDLYVFIRFEIEISTMI